MRRYGPGVSICVFLVICLLCECYGVPVRIRRQGQGHDTVELHDGILLQDYDDGFPDDLHDDGSHVSSLDDLEHTQQLVDDIDHHGNGSDKIDDGTAHGHGAEGFVHDFGIHSHGVNHGIDHEHAEVDHAISGDRTFDGAARAAHVDTDAFEHEHLHPFAPGHDSHESSSGQLPVRTTSGSRRYIEFPPPTRASSDNGEPLDINPVGTIDNNFNVSTNAEHEVHHGFLMGENMPEIDKERAQLNNGTFTFTTSSTTLHQSTTSQVAEQRITVKAVSIPNVDHHEHHQHNESSHQEPTNENAHRSDSEHAHEPVNENEHLHENGIETSTDTQERLHAGHVTLVRTEQNANNHAHNEHEGGHEEPELHPPNVDVPIDKGNHPHDNHEEGQGPAGPPRHTNNPALQTPRHENIFPEVEPTGTTPRLIILPTPAQTEPRGTNSSVENEGSHTMVTRPSTHNEQTEHTELPGEHGEHIVDTGEGHIHGNGGHDNDTGDGKVTEGRNEHGTEEPDVHMINGIKPNKNETKGTDEKQNTSPLYSSSYIDLPSESVTGDLKIESSTVSPHISSPRTTNSIMPISSSNLFVSLSGIYENFPNSQSATDDLYSESFNTQDAGNVPLVTATCLDTAFDCIGLMGPSSLSSTNTRILQTEALSSSSIADSSPSVRLESSATSLLETSITSGEFSVSESTADIQSASPTFERDYSLFTPGIQSSVSSKAVNPTVAVIEPYKTRTTSSLTTSYLSTTPVLMVDVVPTNSGIISETFTTVVQSPHVTQVPSSGDFTPATMVTQASISVPILTFRPTTKKKTGLFTTTTTTTTTRATTPTTRKKQEPGKVPEKPTNISTRSSTRATTPRTLTTLQTLATRLSLVPVTVLTQRPEVSTPPSVYIEIELRMDWDQFCMSRSQFFSEIKDIMLTKKGFRVEQEQFKLNTGDCGANSIMEVSEINSIKIQMYVVDVDGKLDITLTTVTSYVISKGFQQSNYLKDKIVSVHTVGRYQPEKESPDARPETKQAPPAVTMVIVIASMGGVCCVALIILQVLIHRRIKAKRKQRPFVGHRASLQSMDHVALGVIPKSRPTSGYWNPALDETLELPEPDKHSHIMSFSTLANFCMDTKSIYTEFQAIPFDDVDLTAVSTGEEDKNRFANVLPNKHSKVLLKTTPDNPTGYINANYVNGYMEEKRVYIATQSPLVNTVNDFWRMVWEQQSRTILMLNPQTQYEKPKQSTCYWPDNLKTDSRREFGDYVVSLKKRDVQKDYVDCTLEIMDIERNLKRELHHFWFTCWSDTGPPEPLTLVKFVLDTRPHFENSRSPVIIHCGPGTGRTGVYIAVDVCMRTFEDRRRVDILNCVYKMRGERAGAVQTKEQYNLIYQALNEYAVILSSPSISTRSSVITLHAML